MQECGQDESADEACYREDCLEHRPCGERFFHFKFEEGLDHPEAGVVDVGEDERTGSGGEDQ